MDISHERLDHAAVTISQLLMALKTKNLFLTLHIIMGLQRGPFHCQGTLSDGEVAILSFANPIATPKG